MNITAEVSDIKLFQFAFMLYSFCEPKNNDPLTR